MNRLGLLLALAPMTALAQNSGFLTNYDNLSQHVSDQTGLTIMVYVNDDAEQRLGDKFGLMVELPELIVGPDSRYSSIPADDAYIIAEASRLAFIQGLEDAARQQNRPNFRIAEEPAEDVVFVRLAFTNLNVRKNKRGVLGYTPIGAVAKGVKDAVSDTMDKTTLVEMTFEAEMLDSMTGDVLLATTFDFGQAKDRKADLDEEPAEWEATGNLMYTLGLRAFCRFENAHFSADQRRDCLEIPLTDRPARN